MVQDKNYESDFDRVVKDATPKPDDGLKALEQVERQGKRKPGKKAE